LLFLLLLDPAPIKCGSTGSSEIGTDANTNLTFEMVYAER
jgi:hypothetical protein